MDVILPPELLRHVAAARVVLVASGLVAAALWRRRARPLAFALLFGIASALEYFLTVRGAGLTFWGLVGDELFVTAFLERVAAGDPWADFTYAGLPPFYPPYFFWALGGVARILQWNGVQAAKLGAALSIAALPALSLILQGRLWRRAPAAERPSPWGMLVAAAVFLPAVTWDAAVMKPYETVTALLGVQASAFFIAEAGVRLPARRRLAYGAGFAALLGTYYFWGLQVAVAALLALAAYRTGRIARLREYAVAALLALVGSAPFWAPYLLSLRGGIAADQAFYLHAKDFDLFLPFLRLEPLGLLLAAGVLALVVLRRDPVFRALGLLALAPYLWQAAGALVFLLGGRPLVPSKPLLFFSTAAFVTAAGWGLGRLPWERIPLRARDALAAGALALALAFSFGGTFLDVPGVRAALPAMREPSEEVRALAVIFRADRSLLARTWLSSGVPQLSAFVPLDLFVQPTVHFSHPAADWPRRVAFLEDLAASADPETFAAKLAATPWGPVTGLLLYRDGDRYLFYFQEDAAPAGTRERTIAVPARLVTDAAWETRATVGNFSVLTRR